ncbi:MAG: hypothetical protein ACXVNF_10195 [Neobacillus sp.]
MVKENDLNNEVSQEEIMNRVNQTFDKIAQDVKDMINQNDKETNDQYS